MRRTLKYIFPFVLVFFVACTTNENEKKSLKQNQDSGNSADLIKIDFNDSHYLEMDPYANDTITSDGWSIEYFVKDDSTKYSDLYLKCSKENRVGVYHGANLLEFRRYFIPFFAGENNEFIFFTQACATDCSSILVFSKDSTLAFRNFKHIVDYSIPYNQILYVTDSTYKHENKIYELALVNLSDGKTHKIAYSNLCLATFKPSCVDTVIFNRKETIIKTRLLNNYETEFDIQQTEIIKL